MWVLKLATLTEKDDIESYLVTFMVAHKIDKGSWPPLFSPTANRKGAISICSATPDGSCNYAPLTYYDWLRGRPRNTLMARNAREICNFFAHLYLITDKAQINEQNKSIPVGPFYIGTYF